MGIIKESRYIMADITANNNKFWNILLHDDNTVITQWGRVGEAGQSKTFNYPSRDKAERFYEGKCREKAKKGYNESKVLAGTFSAKQSQPSNLAEVAKKQIVTNSPVVLKLVEYLSKVNVHQILSSTTMSYDTSKGTFSTPLGIVTNDALVEARNLLTQIGNFVKAKDYTNPVFTRTANMYLMRIPRDIGRGRPDLKNLYPDLKEVQNQNGILDALEASLQMVLSSGNKGKKISEPKLFEATLNHVESGNVIDMIRKKYKGTAQNMHACAHLDVDTVYEVNIGHMANNFEKKGRPIGGVEEFWHGSRCSNVLSILKSGLLIPPHSAPHVCGRAYGDGLYFAPSSTKSLNYSYGYWDGRTKDNECFMFLASVAMGKHFVPKGGYYRYPVSGYDSTWAKGRVSGVIHDECIVYRTYQANLKYLIKFSSKKR